MPSKQDNNCRICSTSLLIAAALACTVALAAPAKPTAPAKPGAAAAAPAASARPPGAKSSASTAQDKDRVIVQSADHLNYDGTKKVYILQGHIRMKHKDVVLTCDYAEYHDDTDTADCRGHLKLKDPDSTITGDTMHIDFGTEIATIDGNVVIVTQKKKKKQGEAASTTEAKGKPAAAKTTTPAAKAQGEAQGKSPAAKTSATSSDDSDHPHSIEEVRERLTTIHCPHVKYRYTEGKRYAWITGPITAEQKDRTADAAAAEYDGEQHILKLAGPVTVTTKEGDVLHFKSAVISTDEEWMHAVGGSGIVIRRHKTKTGASEQSKPAGTSAPAPAPASAPAPPSTPPPAK